MKKFKKKIKCSCGCNNSLFIIHGIEDGHIFIGTDHKDKTYKNFNGVGINAKDLIKYLNDKIT